ncbi:hypothetical protein SAMN05421736_12025 [Evansella caseinilytica]|uniref:Uncharacterized protein n=1 Tax=Evansella caseinilytica TaxID=1503961 RepID=A0A1H3UBW9_9BACI|nr:hypothetical protein SAMN05421736_12025 [Evansella caseinilytica]
MKHQSIRDTTTNLKILEKEALKMSCKRIVKSKLVKTNSSGLK